MYTLTNDLVFARLGDKMFISLHTVRNKIELSVFNVDNMYIEFDPKSYLNIQ